MCDQEVESCDCIDEWTECSDARVQGEVWSGYSRCWVLQVIRANSLQSASSQTLAKLIEPEQQWIE